MNSIENEIKSLLNLFSSAKYELTVSKAKKLIRKFPQYLILYNILGSAYQNIGDLNLARNIFFKGYQMDSNNIAIMNNLANGSIFGGVLRTNRQKSKQMLFKKIRPKFRLTAENVSFFSS